MSLPSASAADKSLDFALLQQSVARTGGRNRFALWWLLGLLTLLLGLVATLLLYLNQFETEEAARRQAADAQWLEQSVQFHFRRLEDDLLALAHDTAMGKAEVKSGASGVAGLGSRQSGTGLLLQERGVVLASGWLPAVRFNDPWTGSTRWNADRQSNPDNAQALDLMQSTSQGLRRPSYAGLMLQADGKASDVVWVAVPLFDRGQFVGSYLAAVSLARALAALVPGWFTQEHSVRLVTDDAAVPSDAAYLVGLNLPGTDVFAQVKLDQAQPATVPRIFFLVALLFLLGMLVSLYALRRDFVKRQQVQALLQAQVALRTAMENSVTIGLRAWDLKGQILYVNEAFCKMVGYAPQELIGRSNPFPYWPVDQVDLLERMHRGIIAQGTSGEGLEAQFQHRNGHLIDVLIHEAPLTAGGGEQLGWMSSVLDISERKRTQQIAAQQQEKLEASGRLVTIGEVASTLAHELNQPLGALSSFANGLLNRLNAGSINLPETQVVVERMARLAERAGHIIKRVNAFARQRELSRQRMDLVAFLNRVLSQFVEDQLSAPIWVAPAYPVWVQADELLLEHLVSNLVGNAQDWAAKSGQRQQVSVELTADLEQRLAVLSVADNGPGVSEDEVPHIFNAFFSLKEGGMGMGLAICRSIVEAHHGRIEVSRDALLGGARFTVLMPLAETV
jgi:two-component system sensor histidine kinase DctS